MFTSKLHSSAYTNYSRKFLSFNCMLSLTSETVKVQTARFPSLEKCPNRTHLHVILFQTAHFYSKSCVQSTYAAPTLKHADSEHTVQYACSVPTFVRNACIWHVPTAKICLMVATYILHFAFFLSFKSDISISP